MKRKIALLLAVIMVIGTMGITAFASEFPPIFYASPSISLYRGALLEGNDTGELIINFRIEASNHASYVGVDSIKIYKSTGHLVDTINGSISNGLIVTNEPSHAGDYIWDEAVSGQRYYAEVELYAVVNGIYDSRTPVTGRVTAP